ncbi:peptidase C14 caspase catalytic subunit p20 [Labilithrix luteola]|uniref:Peptidase C14 caspase catalytic subunit p20 n=1 Tax=Labilithrix luteola TaxID=1391654 RepID=A0A0K1PYZ5_9BACT|nr:peptidase C14 caspase catalytic subunit p20 [Labilithrix luteola]
MALLLVTSPSRADPLRLLVAIGHHSGLAGDVPLKHSARDATRVRDLFVQLGGVRPEDAFLMVDPTPAQVFAAIDKVAAIASGRQINDVSVLFYFSGHGDRQALHLGRERILLSDLDRKLAGVAAGLRIVVTDACRTSDLRGKGVTSTDPFSVTLDATPRASGVIRLHASADGEVAQESDELASAVFTHYWLSGLAGAADVNGDARVTFDESYAFAYSQTLFRSARASGVVQRPAVETALREGAPIVLTNTTSTTLLRFPRAADSHYIIYGVGSRTVLAELWSSSERRVALAVPPGRYIVHRRTGGHAAAAQLDLDKDQEREVHAADFHAVPEETLARKGGDLILHPNELSVGYVARTSRLYDFGHELGVRYEHAWDSFALGISGTGGTGSGASITQESTVSWLGLDGVAEVRSTIGRLVLRAGAGPRVLTLVRSFVRNDAERLALAGYNTERRFRGMALGGHALVGARLSLGSRLWLDLDARSELLGVRVNGEFTAAWSAGAGADVGLSF